MMQPTPAFRPRTELTPAPASISTWNASRPFAGRRSLLLAAALGSMLPVFANAAPQDDTPGEAAALRCSAISQLHSTLTVPSPQFGELMGDIAGLFAQIYTTQRQARIKGKPNASELKGKRETVLTDIIKGWPANKNALVLDAAACNAWRIALFARLPEKPSEKEFSAALLNAGLPPSEIPKTDLDKWAALTPQAMGAWTAIKAPAKKP